VPGSKTQLIIKRTVFEQQVASTDSGQWRFVVVLDFLGFVLADHRPVQYSLVSGFVDYMLTKPEYFVLLVGLDAAGKSVPFIVLRSITPRSVPLTFLIVLDHAGKVETNVSKNTGAASRAHCSDRRIELYSFYDFVLLLRDSPLIWVGRYSGSV
jgi:hypothetical protein